MLEEGEPTKQRLTSVNQEPTKQRPTSVYHDNPSSIKDNYQGIPLKGDNQGST